MEESTHRVCDVWLRIASALGGIAAFVFGVMHYTNEQEVRHREALLAERLERQRELRVSYFNRDLETLSSIVTAASRVAVAAGANDFSEATREYERLYWGTVTLEEDEEVVRTMDALRSAIRHYRNGYRDARDSKPEDSLKRRAHALTRACRKAIERRIKDLEKVKVP